MKEENKELTKQLKQRSAELGRLKSRFDNEQRNFKMNYSKLHKILKDYNASLTNLKKENQALRNSRDVNKQRRDPLSTTSILVTHTFGINLTFQALCHTSLYNL